MRKIFRTLNSPSGLTRIVIPAVVAALLVVTTLCALAQQGGTTRYEYDRKGRLHKVILPNGDTVVYDYDAADNVVSIRRETTNTVSITDFTPKSGSVGTQVTIFDRRFSANPGDNDVKFNRAATTHTSAAAT